MWKEIFEDIKRNNKHELSLHQGKLLSLLESNNGDVDNDLFTLKQLNFLQLSNSHSLEKMSNLNELFNLQQLLLFGNKITSLPSGMFNIF